MAQLRSILATTTIAASLFANSAAAQESVTVFAAASLTEPFTQLGKRFEADHPGTAIRFSFAGSQQLVLQLQQGARADVFASADQRWMQTARDSGLVEGESAVLARNGLIVIVPKANPAGIKQLQDLARSGIKLVIAADAVPVGRYTRQMLDKLSAKPDFGRDYASKVLANAVSFEENVKGVVAKVQLGEADAGVVYRSDAMGTTAAQVATLEIPEDGNVIASYPIAVVKGAPSPELAKAFVALVTSPEGQATLAGAGFMPATGKTTVSAP